MHPSFKETKHRPWELPTNSWSWRQSWNDLLFVHYRIDVKDIRHLVPIELKIQEFDGSSWIGIVPFKMNKVMRRPFPNLPWFSYFLELNVRLYVEYNGKPGVWFLSLDATNPVVVWAGNQFFNLPYKNAQMSTFKKENLIFYTSERKNVSIPAAFEAQYQITSDIFYAKPNTLESFLTERYCFYTKTNKGIQRADVHHVPWPLQLAEGQIFKNTLLEGIELTATDSPILHYSSGVDVVSWNPVVV